MPDDVDRRSSRRPSTSALLAYLGGLVTPAPRVLGFVVRESWRARAAKDSADRPPVAQLTPWLVALAALDEWMVAFMKTPGRVPTPEGFARVAGELKAARDVYARRGWLDDPTAFHPEPPPLEAPHIRRSHWPRLSFEHVSFESGYEPDPEDPAHDRWMSHVSNRTAHAWLLRHPDGADRPWMVCMHAFGMGYPPVDLWGFRAAWLQRELGFNVIVPVAPLHGPRRIGRLSGAAFMTYNILDIVHGFTQAVWDVRRVLSWIRASGGTSIGVYGISMGAHIAGILAGLEPDLQCVLAAFPTCDLAELFVQHGPRRMRLDAARHGLIGEDAVPVHRLVSPLGFPSKVERERLFICAGLADRMATPAQAYRLWEHWDRPRIEWFNMNHVSFLWSGAVAGFVREVCAATTVL